MMEYYLTVFDSFPTIYSYLKLFKNVGNLLINLFFLGLSLET